MRALRITDRLKVYTCDPVVWGAQPHDLASIAAWNLGIYGPSLRHAKIACELEPDDIRLAANLEYIRNAISGDREEAA
jgi:hypothetical protein